MPRQAYPILQWVILTLLTAGLLFGCAGRWDLPMFWAYVGVFSVPLLVVALTVYDPDLAKERFRPGPGGKDWLFVVGRLFVPAHLAVAGLDVGRFHWSDTVPFGAQIAGLVGCAASYGLILWAVAVNRFFSPVVRIQKERGHHVISQGPYRYVRHPAYAAMIFGIPLSALALGSWLSLLPAVAFAVLVVRRTALEDRVLRKELEGYAGYAEKVRYCVVPGLW
jgi:protein-S-isoprenylcysteine O-methyltransferase Ste14